METTSEVGIQTEQGIMPAYCAVPTTRPPWPGVVVIHDFTGMSHDLRAQADWLANEGFLSVAPDLYYWGNRLSCLRTIMRDIGERRGRTFDDIEAARRWLSEHDNCTGNIGVIGFCMGGGYAWRWLRTEASRRRASTTADARPTPRHGCPEPAPSSGASAAPTGHPSADVPDSGWTGCLPSSTYRTT